MAFLLGRFAPAILIGGLAVVSFQVTYADTTQLGRYLTIDNKPKAAQLDLLSQEFQVRFPSSVQTIGDAMEYLLKQSGYSLISEAKRSAELKTTLSKPLPAIDRNFGPMKLKDGLSTLAGPVFTLVNDPLNRVVSFEIRKQFSVVYPKPISK
jgi:type IV pili sensor histidine kinase/response regulator